MRKNIGVRYMENRMQNWSTLFKVLGWIVIIACLIGAIFTMGATLIGVLVGLSLLFTCAVLEWMDGVIDELQGIRKNQQELAGLLGKMGQAPAPSGAEAPHTWAAPTGAQAVESFVSGRPPVQESTPGRYDAREEADIYRRSQHRS